MVDNLAFPARHDKTRQFSPLIVILTGVTNGSITPTSDQGSQTVNAALENPLLGSQARASLLNSYAQYYRIVLKRPQEAVSLMLAAEAADPANVQIQLNLSALAISLGRADIAVTHLREAKLLDTTGSHASDAAMLQIGRAHV